MKNIKLTVPLTIDGVYREVGTVLAIDDQRASVWLARNHASLADVQPAPVVETASVDEGAKKVWDDVKTLRKAAKHAGRIG